MDKLELNASEEVLMKLKEICQTLGWDMALNEGDNKITGMIIGKMEYIESILHEEEDFYEYTIYSPTETQEGMLQ